LKVARLISEPAFTKSDLKLRAAVSLTPGFSPVTKALQLLLTVLTVYLQRQTVKTVRIFIISTLATGLKPGVNEN
jgi:hypothetical protein